jgi:benzylsuccinate CoA-transferase BbsE subunit
MARRRLDNATLSARNAAIIQVCITPFGQTGPYADYQAEDIVAMALGGMLSLAGYPDAAPLAAHGQLAYAAASLFGAVAGMSALLAAEQSGEGEFIDVSMQECVVMGLENAAQFYDLEGSVRKRYAGEQRQAGSGVYHCRDGMIYMLAGGVASNRFWRNSVDWLVGEGVPGAEELADPKWDDVDYLTTTEAKSRFAEIFRPFAATKTKAELYAVGQRRRIPICPIATPADILESRQLISREFFVAAQHPLGGSPIMMPGAPYKLSATPWRVQRPAPTLGQHTGEILSEIGFDLETREVLLREGAI